jgi:hypothetical protein
MLRAVLWTCNGCRYAMTTVERVPYFMATVQPTGPRCPLCASESRPEAMIGLPKREEPTYGTAQGL